jgi:hypothetical protein
MRPGAEMHSGGQVFDILRALDLAPYEWQHALDQAKGNNPYVGGVIDEVMDLEWPWSSCFLPTTSCS